MGATHATTASSGSDAIGWQAPVLSLGLPALLLVDAAWGHVLATIQAKRPNPGFFTAVLLYIPIGIWTYAAAGEDHVLSPVVVLLSAAVGAGLLAQALLIPKFGPRLRYPDVDIPDATAPATVSVDELVAA